MSADEGTLHQCLSSERGRRSWKSPTRSSLSTCSSATEATSTNAAQLPTGEDENIELRLGSGHLWTPHSQTILRRDGRPAFPNGINIRLKQSSKSPPSKSKSKKLVLRDDDNRVICVVATSRHGVYVLYCPTPVREGQKPTKITSNSKMGLYEWAQIRISSSKAVLKESGGTEVSLREGKFESEGKERGFLSKHGNLYIKGGSRPLLVLSFALAVNDVQNEKQKGDQPSLQELAVSLMTISVSDKQESDTKGNHTRISAALYSNSAKKRLKRRASTGTRAA